MCLTVYVSPRGDFDLAKFAEPIDGATALAMSGRAKERRIHLGWPLVERGGSQAFNTYCVSAPDGSLLVRYRKRHPWYPEAWATPGIAPHPVFSIKDVRVMLAICFDVHRSEEHTSELQSL